MEYLFPLLILLLFIPIFLSGRRQRRQAQQMQQLQSSLVPGDEVMTTSGLHGTVVDTTDEETIELEIAPGVFTTWIRAAIRERINPDGHSVDAEDVDDEEVDEVEEADTAADEADEPETVEAETSEAETDARSNGTSGGRS